jgi:hypothetical protein
MIGDLFVPSGRTYASRYNFQLFLYFQPAWDVPSSIAGCSHRYRTTSTARPPGTVSRCRPDSTPPLRIVERQGSRVRRVDLQVQRRAGVLLDQPSRDLASRAEPRPRALALGRDVQVVEQQRRPRASAGTRHRPGRPARRRPSPPGSGRSPDRRSSNRARQVAREDREQFGVEIGVAIEPAIGDLPAAGVQVGDGVRAIRFRDAPSRAMCGVTHTRRSVPQLRRQPCPIVRRGSSRGFGSRLIETWPSPSIGQRCHWNYLPNSLVITGNAKRQWTRS